MNRRNFLKQSLFTVGAGVALNMSAYANGLTLKNDAIRLRTGKKRPNFVFVLIDDLGWKDVGYMGSRYYDTPNIDRLAAEGMVFTDAYANAANCAPTRACFLTGQYSPRHGVYTVNSSARGASSDRRLIPVTNDTTLDSEHVTFAEVLKEAGYVSASMGKWHMGTPGTLGPVEQGFDVNIAGNHDGGPYSGGYIPPYSYPNCTEPAGGKYLTDRLNDEAIKFIETNQDKPFFLYLTHYAVHTPLEAKPKLKDYYETSEKVADKTTLPKQDNSTYAAVIHSADEGIGRIMEKLKQLDLDQDTVVIFFSDNGGTQITDMYPLRGRKGMFYEGGIREPMIVRWKGGVKPGTTCSVPVIGIDFFPTFLELAGVRKPKDKILDGESIVPLMKGAKGLTREAIFWHFPAYLERGDSESRDSKFRTRPVSVIRKGDWKLLLFLEEWILDCGENPGSSNLNSAVELYNLASDIGEQNNLAQSNTAKRDELLADLLAWRSKVGIPTGEMSGNPGYAG